MTISRLHRFAAVVLGLAWPQCATIAGANGARFLDSWAEPNNPQAVLAVFDSGSPAGTCLLRSTDAGATWSRLADPDGSAICRGGRGQVADFFVRPEPSGLTVVHLAPGALRQLGADGAWKKLMPPGGDAEQLIPTGDPARFFAVLENGPARALAATRDGGGSWATVAESVPFSCSMATCDTDGSADGKTLIVRDPGFDGYVSSDGGRTWAAATEGDLDTLTQRLDAERPRRPIRGTPGQVAGAKAALQRPAVRLDGLAPVP